jgi:L-seryl-tRNA(Ser) seleniumtransferase
MMSRNAGFLMVASAKVSGLPKKPGEASEVSRRLRELPKIDELLRNQTVAAIAAPRWAVRDVLRSMVEERRRAILGGEPLSGDFSVEEVAARVAVRMRPSLRRVINATGVVLHTNLGRAPLAEEVARRIADLATGYTNLEYDLDAGRRGSRHGHATELLCSLTGAEDAVVVNNNASAVMLGLAALAGDREVVVSRGELIEIGGSFRIPDVMKLSGAHLVEVGTTNKTHLRDYQRALGENTALLLKVHRSNFAVVGFTAEVESSELASLAREAGVLSMEDLGSGAFVEAAEFSLWGLPAEPSVRQVVAGGIDLVTFSGDKLLGGPQAGLLVGTKEVIERCRKHPLMRALRPDKLTLAGLCASLELYRDERRSEVPAVAMLSADTGALRERAEALVRAIGPLQNLKISVTECESKVGGGAMPTATMQSAALRLEGSARELDDRLRRNAPPIIGRIALDHLLLDVRTLGQQDEGEIVAALRRIDGEVES